MINLDGIRRDTAWLDLPQGVRLRVRPYDGVMWELARLRSVDLAVRVVQETRAAADLGADDLTLPDLKDPLARQAVGNSLFTISLAQAVILEWEGVAQGADSTPAPVQPETVAALMRVQGMADAFLRAYTQTYQVGEAEQGNA